MKKQCCRLLTGVLILSMCICSASASRFPDVSSDASYETAVEYVSELGLMVGDEKGNFNPDQPVTRAQMATILCKLLGEDTGLVKDGTVFQDVPESHWGNAYIVRAVELGFLSGYGNGKVGPDDKVTYEQAITMILNAMGHSEDAIIAGGYPDGYIMVAEQYGYTFSLVVQKEIPLVRSQVAVILFNATL